MRCDRGSTRARSQRYRYTAVSVPLPSRAYTVPTDTRMPLRLLQIQAILSYCVRSVKLFTVELNVCRPAIRGLRVSAREVL